MKSKQLGMTIIELMIVVAIIGILASISVPLFVDYQRRAKVSEAMNLMAGLKTPMIEYYSAWGVWPSVTQVGGKTQGSNVLNVISGQNGADEYYVQATMREGDSELGKKEVRMIYDVDNRSWLCTTQGTANPIPMQYLPSACK